MLGKLNGDAYNDGVGREREDGSVQCANTVGK